MNRRQHSEDQRSQDRPEAPGRRAEPNRVSPARPVIDRPDTQQPAFNTAGTNVNQSNPSNTIDGWNPESWRSKLHAQQVVYEDRDAVARAFDTLRRLPPLVTSGEIERLRTLIEDAQQGRRFLLQGGDCAERLSETDPTLITNRLKILLQMSVVLVNASKRPVIRVGRFAGQYAKPRSSAIEVRKVAGTDVSLPSYFGDLVNGEAFEASARRPDPNRMVEGYLHAALVLNFVRSLVEGGFADLHHPENWDLGFLRHADLPSELRRKYREMTDQLAEGLQFMEALGERAVAEMTRVEFFTSHEGLNLLYESAQTRQVPRRHGWYNLTTHLPWVGERTRDLDGAHIEYFRGIANPVGVKVGPNMDPDQLIRLIDTLNPLDEPGKVVLIHRMGYSKIREKLPALLHVVKREGRTVLWVCDPMHGNTTNATTGYKTRSVDDVMAEICASWDAHKAEGTVMGGVHLELTGEDVTECTGGLRRLNDEDLTRNYASPCDPRLNYEQSMEVAFCIAEKMQEDRRARG